MDGLQLRLERVRQNVSQSRVASLLGVSQSLLCDIEKGRRPVTSEEARSILQAIDLAVQGYEPPVPLIRDETTARDRGSSELYDDSH